MACDICGSNKQTLESLRDIYATDHIKQVCPDCVSVINKQLSKIQSATTNIQKSLLMRFMEVLKGEPK